MENERNSKGLIGIVVLLIILVIGLTGYIVYDKVISKDNTNSGNNETEAKDNTNTEVKENNDNNEIVNNEEIKNVALNYLNMFNNSIDELLYFCDGLDDDYNLNYVFNNQNVFDNFKVRLLFIKSNIDDGNIERIYDGQAVRVPYNVFNSLYQKYLSSKYNLITDLNTDSSILGKNDTGDYISWVTLRASSKCGDKYNIYNFKVNNIIKNDNIYTVSGEVNLNFEAPFCDNTSSYSRQYNFTLKLVSENGSYKISELIFNR